MRFTPPKNDGKLEWTQHVVRKMLFYGISEGLVRRVMKSPKRTEEGVAPGTIAVMQPAGARRQKEVWVMYQPLKKKKRVITAWRYPGRSPVRKPVPVPDDILAELVEWV